jgi:uncharacterized delta-60 repeat protein
MKKILLLITVLLAASAAFAQATANDAFNPNANAVVQKIALAPNGSILMGGGFSNVNGQPRSRMARVFATGIFDSEFSPNVDGNVTAIAVIPSTSKILIAGTFSSVYGESRTNFAQLSPDGGLDAVFTAPNGPARAILPLPDGKFILAGSFTMVGSVPRQFISRQNADGTGDNTFNPSPNGAVEALARQPDGKILVGGSFTSIAGQLRSRLARLNADGTIDATFNVSLNSTVRAVEIQPDGKILVAGNFGTVNGVLRNRLARLYPDGTLDLSFDPNMNNIVWALAVQPDGKFIAGGAFTTVGGAARPALARFNMDGSLDTTFTPSPDSEVYSIAVQPDGKIVFGGFFTAVGGVARGRIARVYRDGTLETEFNPDTGVGFSVAAMLAQPDDKILIGGQFTSVNGTARARLARLNPNGTLDTTLPDLQIGSGGSSVNALARQPDGKILVGGAFNTVGGVNQAALARFLPSGARDTTFNPAILGVVTAVVIQPDGKILVGGSISQVNGSPVANLVRLNADGTRDAAFNFNFNDWVDQILLQRDGKILVRGRFTTVNGTSRPLLARLNPDGATLDTGFAPTFSNTAPAITNLTKIYLQLNGQILVGGNFNNVNGETRQNVVRLNADGAVDTFFVVRANFPATAFAEQSNTTIIIGGQFTTFNNTAVGKLIRVNFVTGVLDPFYVPNLNGTPGSILVQPDGKIMVAGLLTSVGGAARTGMAKIVYGNDHSTYDLGIAFNNTLNWEVGLSLPQPHRVFVDWSTDGVNYAPLGEADPFGQTWQVYPFLRSNGFVRLRAVYPDASNQQSSMEIVKFIPRRGSAAYDFDGDGKTDVGIFRPSNGSWWYTRSVAPDFRVYPFGAPNDILAPGDFTGDGKTDLAVFRPATGEWFIQRSEDNSFFSFPFGASGDIPAPADYDADGKTDAAVFRPSTGTWFILNSGGSGTSIVNFGIAEDKPVPADFDGDGKANIAIFRPSDGSWWYLESTIGSPFFKVFRFGSGTDKPVPGDYTGDGRADIAVFRPSTGEWFVQRSDDNSFYSVPFGAAGDIPAPGDYDGDGLYDTAVFRPSTANWFVQRSSAGILITTFGTNGDRPIPNAFVP